MITRMFVLVFLLAVLVPGVVSAQSFETEVRPLVQGTCVRCHGARTVTPLNFEGLGYDLTDHETFRTWEKVYERLMRGEMPPPAAPRPDADVVDTALGSLKRALVDANLAARGEQRTWLRRLTRLEYGHTITDLLRVDPAVGAEVALGLPAEADSGGVDTIASNQAMSPLHVQSYLAAADLALDAALAVGPRPPTERRTIDYAQSQYLRMISQAKALGLGIVKPLDDAVVAFFDFGSTYTFHSLGEGFGVPYPGRYRVAVEAYPYQATSPVSFTVHQGRLSGVAASLDQLIGSYDLVGDTPRTVEVTRFLRPGELIGLSVAELDVPADLGEWRQPADPSQGYGGMKDYPGEGVAFKSMTIEGPLLETWPPLSTRELLAGVDFEKGCYVGQEVTARMKHRGLVRKRLLPVEIDGPAPAPGTVVLRGEMAVGEIRSSIKGQGLALLRLEDVERATAGEVPLLAGDARIHPQIPDWMRIGARARP